MKMQTDVLIVGAGPTGLALATALLVARIVRFWAGGWGPVLAGTLYLATLPMFGGAGGQSPVFYNLWMAMAAWAVLRATPALSHGRIPAGSWVLMRTDWSQRRDPEAYQNFDETGQHTPGPSAEAAQFLVEQRGVLGFGSEAIGTDAGQGYHLSRPLVAENVELLLDRIEVDRWGLQHGQPSRPMLHH